MCNIFYIMQPVHFSFSIPFYGGLFMINSVNDILAQQIVDTVKDICGHDINFIRPDGSVFASTDPDYLADCLKEFAIDLNSPKRFILIQVNSGYPQINMSLLDQKISRLFSQTGIRLFTFRCPREFLAVTEEKDYEQNRILFQQFAQNNKELIKMAVGKPEKLFHLYASYNSSRTVLKSLSGSGRNFAVFDDLTLELILSSVDENSKKDFLQKTTGCLSTEELAIIKAYFSEDMSLAGTCSKLYLHKNTLQYKLNHIYKKSGLNPRRFRDAVLLYLALKLSPLRNVSFSRQPEQSSPAASSLPSRQRAPLPVRPAHRWDSGPQHTAGKAR